MITGSIDPSIYPSIHPSIITHYPSFNTNTKTNPFNQPAMQFDFVPHHQDATRSRRRSSYWPKSSASSRGSTRRRAASSRRPICSRVGGYACCLDVCVCVCVSVCMYRIGWSVFRSSSPLHHTQNTIHTQLSTQSGSSSTSFHFPPQQITSHPPPFPPPTPTPTTPTNQKKLYQIDSQIHHASTPHTQC
jgi:hypothetical protein